MRIIAINIVINKLLTMAYIIEQTIKGKIYLYNVESYWDKAKKQSRQKRTYIGPKNPVKKAISKQELKEITIKKYGSVFLLKYMSEKIGLKNTLSEIFPENFDKILNLCYYQISDENPEYLFEYWFEQNYLQDSKKMSSSKISELYTTIGNSQVDIKMFLKNWIEYLNPIKTIYYDITSISSYSENNDFIEWGYNRDSEKLAQLNLGLVYCKESSLPIYYQSYTGSLTDVKTLKNTVDFLSGFGLKEFLLILDRGFFSTSNILSLAKDKSNISFIQPLPFSLKKVRGLARKYARETSDYSNAFLYNDSLLYHSSDTIDFEDETFNAHIFLNEKTKQAQKEAFLKSLLSIEQRFKNKTFESLKEYKDFRNNEIPDKFKLFFKWRKFDKKIEKNRRAINEYLSKNGIFVMANNTDLDRLQIIDYYRSKDSIEKVFDVMKNELLGKRLRAHSKESAEGRLFVKFITSILYSSISKIMKEKALFKNYSLRELMLELNKIQRTQINKKNIIFSELTKKQNKILEAFDINWKEKHSY
ncbi:MAG: IS1634 family transposase [Bacteroidetes bacterium]|nr:MAG: IS1634 family transposase [Bacteroidota bacterium]